MFEGTKVIRGWGYVGTYFLELVHYVGLVVEMG
jgi:hypothetical protein